MDRYRDAETHKLQKDIRSFAPYVKIPLYLPQTKLITPKRAKSTGTYEKVIPLFYLILLLRSCCIWNL
jgi:hypothetical protein